MYWNLITGWLRKGLVQILYVSIRSRFGASDGTCEVWQWNQDESKEGRPGTKEWRSNMSGSWGNRCVQNWPVQRYILPLHLRNIVFNTPRRNWRNHLHNHFPDSHDNWLDYSPNSSHRPCVLLLQKVLLWFQMISTLPLGKMNRWSDNCTMVQQKESRHLRFSHALGPI